jgi:uncharacterized protein (DUF1330 family)
MTTPAYLIAQIDVKNLDRYLEEYGFPVLEQLKAEGAEVLVGAPDATVLEGEWSGNWTVVIRFPDEDRARRWYESPRYAPLKAARIGRLTNAGNVVLARGFEPPPR